MPNEPKKIARRGREVAMRIMRFDRGRDPKLLKRKYKLMCDSPLAFLRGSLPLFYEDLPRHPLLRAAPAAWSCGDLHLENFGTYKGDNRQVYFDVGDFDEAALAPCTWDPLRCATSILMGAKMLRLKRPARLELCRRFIDAYADALADGKSRWIERETTTGMIHELIDAARKRHRRDFLDERTVRKGRHRKLLIDGTRALPVAKADRKRIRRFMKKFAKERQDHKFFKPIDVARRIAGVGSLGVERYVVLVQGHGSPDSNHLIDLKQEPAAGIRSSLRLKQPRWKSEADRVVAVQKRVQAIAPAFLRAVRIDGRSFVVKELQPTSDKIYLARWGGKAKRLEQLFATMGEIVAWGQLRAAGRDGAAPPARMIAFGARRDWRRVLVELADHCSEKLLGDWKAFREVAR
jgi:uncharacterized protein (DUF2252 family)